MIKISSSQAQTINNLFPDNDYSIYSKDEILFLTRSKRTKKLPDFVMPAHDRLVKNLEEKEDPRAKLARKLFEDIWLNL